MRAHRIERLSIRREDSRSSRREWIPRCSVLRIERNVGHATQIQRRTVWSERHSMERHRFSAFATDNARQLKRCEVST